MEKISEITLCFVSTLEKHLQLKQYQDLFFERTKYVYFLYQLNLISVSLQNHDETDCVSEQFREKQWIQIETSEAVCLLNSPLLERSADLSDDNQST